MLRWIRATSNATIHCMTQWIVLVIGAVGVVAVETVVAEPKLDNIQ